MMGSAANSRYEGDTDRLFLLVFQSIHNITP
jgi:hypothetical protein